MEQLDVRCFKIHTYLSPPKAGAHPIITHQHNSHSNIHKKTNTYHQSANHCRQPDRPLPHPGRSPPLQPPGGPSFIHSFIHSFVHSFIHSFMRSFIHSFVHSFIHSFIRSFIYSFIHSHCSDTSTRRGPIHLCSQWQPSIYCTVQLRSICASSCS